MEFYVFINIINRSRNNNALEVPGLSSGVTFSLKHVLTPGITFGFTIDITKLMVSHLVLYRSYIQPYPQVSDLFSYLVLHLVSQLILHPVSNLV